MPDSTCKNCSKPILVAIFKGGEWCGDDCRKELVRKENLEAVIETMTKTQIPTPNEVRAQLGLPPKETGA